MSTGRRYIPKFTAEACLRHQGRFTWSMNKIAAVRTIEHAAMSLRDPNPAHSSHTCGLYWCIDDHCEIEDAGTNLGSREDCFSTADDAFEAGFDVPQFCSHPDHAGKRCRLWHRVEGRAFPQSMLIKEKAMYLGKRPEELSDTDIGPKFAIKTGGKHPQSLLDDILSFPWSPTNS